MRIYSSYYDNTANNGFENVLDATAYHLQLTPAERATLATVGAVRIENLIEDTLWVNMETAPEERTAAEIMYVNDYGVMRWWANDATQAVGAVQL